MPPGLDVHVLHNGTDFPFGGRFIYFFRFLGRVQRRRLPIFQRLDVVGLFVFYQLHEPSPGLLPSATPRPNMPPRTDQTDHDLLIDHLAVPHLPL